MEAMTNAGCVQQLRRFAQENGIVLERAFDAELKEWLIASDKVDQIPAHVIVDMLQLGAAFTKRSDFGVAAAAASVINGGFGPLSLVWEYSPSLSEAIRINRRYIGIEDGAVTFDLVDEGGEVALRHIVMAPGRCGSSQYIEAQIMLHVRVVRMVFGDEAWSPVRVEFAHPAPDSARQQHLLFRCPLHYDAQRNAIVFSRSDLARPGRNANARMFTYLEQRILGTPNVACDDLARKVETFIAANLVHGTTTLEHAAKELGISQRALQRHLADRNLAFSDVLAKVRERMTKDYFHSVQRPNLAELAYRLGYSDSSAASRYLRKYLGTGAKALTVRAGQDAIRILTASESSERTVSAA
jgi:AraC-like DNA-binding protein